VAEETHDVETGNRKTDAAGARSPSRSSNGKRDVAECILESARRILSERGWEGLTISAVSEDAGVYRAAINYHFGSKEGLVAALLDRIIVQTAHNIMHRIPDVSSEERVLRTIAALDMLGGRDAQVDFFEAFAHLLRDQRLSERLVRLYRDVIALSAITLGADTSTVKAMEPYAVMTVAFTDGLIIQQLVEPDRDFYPVVQAFIDAVTPAVEAVAAKVSNGERRE
jgi:AcrR family transcriptional regulator